MDNLGSIAERWAAMLATSASLKAWCGEKYGEDPTVYLGLNVKKPPSEADCPVVVVLPESTEMTNEGYPNDATITILWSVANEEQEEDDDGVRIMTGLSESEEFGREIWDVIQTDGTVYPQSVTFELDPAGSFPQFPGSMEIVIKYK